MYPNQFPYPTQGYPQPQQPYGQPGFYPMQQNPVQYPMTQGMGYGMIPNTGMGYGMTPNMGTGYGMTPNNGMGMPSGHYGYRSMNFNNHQMYTYGLNRNMIDMYGESLFRKYDRNMSGTLDLNELCPLINEFMLLNGLGAISPMDANYLAYMFDFDGSGFINYMEFKMMLKHLGGIKSYDRNMIMNKRMYKKHKKHMKKGHKNDMYGYY